MNPTYIHTLIDPSIRTIGVQFFNEMNRDGSLSPKIYTYKTRLELEEGDLVVVKSPHGYKVVKVVRIDEVPNINPDDKHTFKWALQKVNQEDYEQSVEDDLTLENKLRLKEREATRARLSEAISEKYGDVSKLIETK